MLNTAFIGRTYPPTPAYQVGREKIRKFAAALNDGNPIYHDETAARGQGRADIVAPPTFAVILTRPAAHQAITDPELGADFSRVVHGETALRVHPTDRGRRRADRSRPSRQRVHRWSEQLRQDLLAGL